jgi:SAM-dependent methyltransferase
MQGYSEYQKKYAEQIRESDKVLIGLIQKIKNDAKGDGRLSVLDIGCSTGNLLLHLKHALPELVLTGGDMVPSILDQCRNNPALSGINFEEMNILELDPAKKFDIIITNAVLYMLWDEEMERAFASIAAALKPEGWFVTFDFFHPFEQDLAILEKSKTHPDGLMLHFRPYSKVRPALEKNHLNNISFMPFSIPIELEKPEALDELNTYTVRSESGGNLLFRGTLYQPWCHLIAQKSI